MRLRALLLLVLGVVAACSHQGPTRRLYMTPKEPRALKGPVVVFDPMVRCPALDGKAGLVDVVLAREMADLAPHGIAFRSFVKDIEGYDDFVEHAVKMAERAGDDGRMTALMEVEWTFPFLASLVQLPERIESVLKKRSFVPQRPDLVLVTMLMCEGPTFTGAIRWRMEMDLLAASSKRLLWRYEDTFSSAANETGAAEQAVLAVHAAIRSLRNDISITR